MQAFRHLLLTCLLTAAATYFMQIEYFWMKICEKSTILALSNMYSKLGEVNLRSEYIGMYVLYISKKLFQPHDTTPRCVIDCTFFSISGPVSSLQTLIIVVEKRQCMQIIFFLTAFILQIGTMCKQSIVYLVLLSSLQKQLILHVCILWQTCTNRLLEIKAD